MKIWTLSENVQFGAELVTAAHSVAQDVEVVSFTAEAASVPGSARTVVMPLVADQPWENYFLALSEKARAERPQLIICAATRRCKTVAAMLAAALEAPCVSDCRAMRLDGAAWQFERMIFGGLAIKTVSTTAATIVVTVGRGTYEASKGGSGDQDSMAASASSVQVVARMPKPASNVNLPEADRVVSVGRGFESEAELSMARDLCAAMNAELSCSRPIAEFFKWLPEERYIGISGQVIRPKVYVACGISGQAQHVYGIRDAKVIVAINKDEKAPIMEQADYAIIGNIRDVLPALTAALKQ